MSIVVIRKYSLKEDVFIGNLQKEQTGKVCFFPNKKKISKTFSFFLLQQQQEDLCEGLLKIFGEKKK